MLVLSHLFVCPKNISKCTIYACLSKIVTMKICIKKDLIERKLYKVDFIFGFAFFVISGFAPKQYVSEGNVK